MSPPTYYRCPRRLDANHLPQNLGLGEEEEEGGVSSHFTSLFTPPFIPFHISFHVTFYSTFIVNIHTVNHGNKIAGVIMMETQEEEKEI